ncbi:ABC transporter ATP-binding protein [Pseudoroseomonas cervicalis]|uniref:Glutathione import ATP-binding protein GsiA n=1 Tax=Pseudoroseomonas cervicalis ATCC 49957 TaxID=525371 RepID=D5RJM0_9PROT|nr:ABC transporter ATP-binding protein [Pseudoroseomonas cervicalis]EFH12504.1 ABC transporter, ATP-binding protein [Pseudoroseomonas cervicalis ATCC 49957]
MSLPSVPMLEAIGLDIRFGKGARTSHAVREVSFRVMPGEAFGLIGESGSGKSTVLRALSGLNSAYGGSLLMQGKELPHSRDRAFHRRVQMVFQDPYGSLHPRKMVNQVLLEPLAIHGLDRPQQRVDAVLEAVGLGAGFRFRYPHQLSGGQRQRVAIARCLVLEPEILLLDEPTSALDVSVQAEILNLLQRLRAERGLTYVMVSHDLAVVAHLCGRVAIMSQGRIVEELPVADLRAGRAEDPYSQQLLAASAAPINLPD